MIEDYETPTKRVRVHVGGPEDGNSSHSASNRPPLMPSRFCSNSVLPTPSSTANAFNQLLSDLNSKHQLLCLNLNLDSESKEKSGQLFKCYIDSLESKEIQTELVIFGSVFLSIAIWAGCLLAHDNNPHHIGVSLSQIIMAAQITPTDFFGKTPIFLSKCHGLSQDQKTRLDSEMKTRGREIYVLTQMSSKMKECFAAFISPSSIDPNIKRIEDAFVSECLRFSWLLYLYTSEKLIPEGYKTPENYISALFCSIRFVFKHIPVNLLKPTGEVLQKISMTHLQTPDNPLDLSVPWKFYSDLIFGKLLQSKYNIGPEVFASNEDKFNKAIDHNFIKTNLWAFTDYKDGFVTDVFDVKNHAGIQKNADVLNKEYQILHKTSGSIDGRFFMNKKTIGSLTPRKVGCTPSALQRTVTHSRNLKSQIQKASSLSASMLSTPLTAKSMCNKRSAKTYADDNYTTGERLRMILSTQCEGPTAALLGYFKECDPDPTPSIMERIQKAVDQLMRCAPNEVNTYQLAVKFYFRTMELMLRGEESSGVPRKQMLMILNDSKFHRSLLCCAFELTRHCFDIKSFDFIQLLKYLKVSMFDLCMVIELSIKYDGQLLNWNLIKRLKEIEERILECEIWQSENPLYRYLEMEAENGTLDSPRKALSFVTMRPNYFSSGECSSSACDSISTTSLEIFFRKLYRLLYSRLLNFSQVMGMPQRMIEQIWNIIVEALLVERINRVFLRRHIDQVILCTIYGVAKVNNIPLKMSEIINHYSKQPQANQDIANNIQLDDGQKGTLIDYYNKDYISRMKHLICSSKSESGCGKLTLNQHPVPMSPMRLSAINSFAKKQACEPSFMSPRTKVLYNHGEPEKLGVASAFVDQSKKSRKLNFRDSSLKRMSPQPADMLQQTQQ